MKANSQLYFGIITLEIAVTALFLNHITRLLHEKYYKSNILDGRSAVSKLWLAIAELEDGYQAGDTWMYLPYKYRIRVIPFLTSIIR